MPVAASSQQFRLNRIKRLAGTPESLNALATTAIAPENGPSVMEAIHQQTLHDSLVSVADFVSSLSASTSQVVSIVVTCNNGDTEVLESVKGQFLTIF